MQRVKRWIRGVGIIFFLVQYGLFAEGNKISVFVSIQPQAFIVKKIAGESVEVNVLVPPGKNPHAYEPAPQQMALLAQSSVLFTIGLPFEKVLAKKIKNTMPEVKIEDMTEGIAKRRMEEDEEHDHEHEEHSHEERDPHVWLSPSSLKIMAENAAKVLSALKPEDALKFSANLDGLKKELDVLDSEIAAQLSPVKGKIVLIYHPVLGYFTDAYGLKQKTIEIKGKSPSPKQPVSYTHLTLPTIYSV